MANPHGIKDMLRDERAETKRYAHRFDSTSARGMAPCTAALLLVAACTSSDGHDAGSQADAATNANMEGSASSGVEAGHDHSGTGPMLDSGWDSGDGDGEEATSTNNDTELDNLPCDDQKNCPAGAICTVSDVCGEIHGSCETDSDCDGDTYCCHQDCRADGAHEGVCVSHDVPPGSQSCKTPPGASIFAPDVQCVWNPGEGTRSEVQHSPLVADLPFGPVGRPEIVFLSTSAGAQLTIIDGQDCELQQAILPPAAQAWVHPALADLNNDGVIDIVISGTSRLFAYTWDGSEYKEWWQSDNKRTGQYASPAIHDINDDGFPEVLAGFDVFDGRTGSLLNPNQSQGGYNGFTVVADLDDDPAIELVSSDVWQWADGEWELEYPGVAQDMGYVAYADFGTPGASADDFDYERFDGIAEIVATTVNGRVTLTTLDATMLQDIQTGSLRSGTPTIGDFDDDGFPEIARAGAEYLSLYDPGCGTGQAGCVDDILRWQQPSQDQSSGQTGVSLFDFQGDGATEVVYADECYLRIYDGSSGEVLFSTARMSYTWAEYPVVADVDGDQNTEVVINMAASGHTGLELCAQLSTDGQRVPDPIHGGQQCETDEQCVSGRCEDELCRCTDDTDCRTDQGCVAPLPGTPGSGMVCRAMSPDETVEDRRRGVWVFRDALDRWVSSRPLWNQAAYTITNIEDDGSIPKSSDWQANFRDPALNNFLQNRQGDHDSGDWPEITGALEKDDVCVPANKGVVLKGRVCNRGTKAVGAKLPATFYQGTKDGGDIICTSYTESAVPTGACMDVTCVGNKDVRGLVTMVANDDGMGGQTALECNADNNTDTVEIDECIVPPSRTAPTTPR